MSSLTGIQRTSGSELTTIRASWDRQSKYYYDNNYYYYRVYWTIIFHLASKQGIISPLSPSHNWNHPIPAPLVLLIGLFTGWPVLTPCVTTHRPHLLLLLIWGDIHWPLYRLYIVEYYNYVLRTLLLVSHRECTPEVASRPDTRRLRIADQRASHGQPYFRRCSNQSPPSIKEGKSLALTDPPSITGSARCSVTYSTGTPSVLTCTYMYRTCSCKSGIYG